MKVLLLLFAFSLTSCATNAGAGTKARGLLRLEVVPNHADIFVNEEYRGQVKSWHDQTLVLPVGMHRLQLVAKGYFSQRFDIQIVADELVTLRLDMEEEFETLDEEPL